MKISWNWLAKYVDLSGIDPVETGNLFTLAVAELEGVEKVGEGLEAVTAVKIIKTEPHPHAKKLTLATIDCGGGITRTVVCGAPNAREGLVTVLADVGTRVLDKNGEPFEIGEAEIRGVKSAGMLASPLELGLGEDHSGIMELPGNIAPGTVLAEIAPIVDWVWDIDNKSITHRPDLWEHVGIAREVAALVGRELKFEVPMPAFTDDEPLTILNEEHERCPRYTAYTMDGIKVGAAPLWMQVLLYHAEQRPINNIVDFTNYVMMSVGNPLHAFDARQIEENTIRIRCAGEGEKMSTLDGEKHTLNGEDLVIADKNRPVALAGIMGGLNSEVEPDTTNIILESANFHAGRIRKSAARLGIRTESSARFEKSLDPHLAQKAAWHFANLVCEHIPEAKVSSKFYDAGAPLPEPVIVKTSCDFIRQRLGTHIGDERILEILTGLSFDVHNENGNLTVSVPSFRATKDIGIPEDIVEEVRRIHGYINIPPTAPKVELEKPWALPSKGLERRLRDTLALELGFNEAMTYSFDKASLMEKAGRSLDDAIWLENPISKEEPVLRQSLLLNLIDAVKRNERSVSELRLFETGRVFFKSPGGKIPLQPRRLAMVLSARGLKGDTSAELFYRMKYAMERIGARLERGELTIDSPDKETLGESWVHPARSADVYMAGRKIGYMSVIHPGVAKALSLKSDLVLASVDLDAVVSLPRKHKLFEPLPKFPGIEHDISIIVDKSCKAQEIIDDLKGLDELVKSVACVDSYEGDKFRGKRSLTFRITFLHPERTLSGEEVTAFHVKCTDLVTSKFQGQILG